MTHVGKGCLKVEILQNSFGLLKETQASKYVKEASNPYR